MPNVLPASSQQMANLANFMGLYVSGDIGDHTTYTTRKGRVVIFPKSPPKKPATAAQLHQRDRFRTAQSLYMTLSQTEKADWEFATQAISLDATGQNCWISLALRPDSSWTDWVSRKAGVSLTPPPFVP